MADMNNMNDSLAFEKANEWRANAYDKKHYPTASVSLCRYNTTCGHELQHADIDRVITFPDGTTLCCSDKYSKFTSKIWIELSEMNEDFPRIEKEGWAVKSRANTLRFFDINTNNVCVMDAQKVRLYAIKMRDAYLKEISALFRDPAPTKEFKITSEIYLQKRRSHACINGVEHVWYSVCITVYDRNLEKEGIKVYHETV